MDELLAELKIALDTLDRVYRERDEIIRRTNLLMIEEHNLLAQIKRINVDLVKEG